MMAEPVPADPMTQLAEGAAQLHELFLAYKAAGFSEAQAIYLIGVTLRSAIGRQPDA
jgi:hypothetical protein